MKKYYLLFLFCFALILKIVLIETKADFKRMNPDEERNYSIAQNYVDGNSYTIDGKPSAFHPSLSVFVYQFLIKNHISKTKWIRFFHYLCILIFIVSAYYFYCFSKLLLKNEMLTLLSTFIYIIYPSNLIYIGNIYLLEKLVMPILVISFYFIYQILFTEYKLNLIQSILLAIGIATACFLRHQLIIIFFALFLFAWLYTFFIKKAAFNRSSIFKLSVITALAMVMLCIPVLSKNYKLFNA